MKFSIAYDVIIIS